MKLSSFALVLTCLCGSVSAFSTRSFSHHRPSSSLILRADAQQDAFTAFADSLQVEEEHQDDHDESWQERLEMLLDPLTPLAQRQILLSELMASNDEIRNSVTVALRERNVRTT